MRLAGVRLRVADPQRLAQFYGDVLGMTVRTDGDYSRVGYDGIDADLLLLPGGGGYLHDRGQRYWKIGITVPDVDLAADYLRRAGIEINTPRQFLDIGYMCHLQDPEGFSIELLQHDFEGNRPAAQNPDGHPFEKATIGQVTLRTGDIQAEHQVCHAMGMRLMSLQSVEQRGFDLHFYAFSDEKLPNPDLWSVDNREWLWKRPYTTLEFQHIEGARFVPSPDYRGLVIEGLNESGEDAFGDPLVPC